MCVSHLAIYKYEIQHAAFSCANFGSYVIRGSFPITWLFLNGRHLRSQFMPPASPPVCKKKWSMFQCNVCATGVQISWSEHIQNLPWPKLHTLLLTTKPVTATCLYLRICHCRGLTPAAKGVWSFFVSLKALAHRHSCCFNSFGWEGHLGRATWRFPV